MIESMSKSVRVLLSSCTWLHSQRLLLRIGRPHWQQRLQDLSSHQSAYSFTIHREDESFDLLDLLRHLAE